jgi:disulfide bond formation protein DsbB
MNNLTYKSIQVFNAVITAGVLFASFYFQYIKGLVPCPLCLMQRLCVFLLLVVMGLSLCTVKKVRILNFFQIIISCAGLFFSLRQLWLQSLPPGTTASCMPGLDILIHYFPWHAVLKALVWGSSECSEVSWHMLGISMAGWCAVYFLFITIMSLFSRVTVQS